MKRKFLSLFLTVIMVLTMVPNAMIFSSAAAVESGSGGNNITQEPAHDLSEIPYKAPTCTETGNNQYYKCNSCGLYFKVDSSGVDIKGKFSAAIPSCNLTEPQCEFIYDSTPASAPGFVFDTVRAGNSVTVNIYAKELYGLNSANIDFNYPADMMKLNSVKKGIDSMAEDNKGFTQFNSEWNVQNPGEVKFGFLFTDNLWTQEIWTANGYDVNAAYFHLFTINFSITGSEYVPTDIQSEIIPALGHDLETFAYKAPTCTETGNNDYYKCKRCGLYFKDSAAQTATSPDAEKLPALNHDLSFIPPKNPTCSEDGNNGYYKCNNCGLYFKKNPSANTDINGKFSAEFTYYTINGQETSPHYEFIYDGAQASAPGFIFDSVKEGNSVTVKVYAKELYGLTSTNAIFRYPAEMMSIDSVENGTDAAAKNNEGFTQFNSEWNDQNPGKVIFGFYFTDKLWTQENWTAEGYNVNAAYFHLFTMKFSLTQPDYIPTDTESEAIPALGHDLETFAYKAPTCTEDGNNEYYKCKRCGLYFRKGNPADVDLNGKLSADFTSCQINGQKTSPHYEFIYDGTQASASGFIFDTVKEGNSVTVNVYAKELPEFESANITFRYPKELLTGVSVADGADAKVFRDTKDDRFDSLWNEANPGLIYFGFYFLNNLGTDTADMNVNAAYFHLFTINFNITDTFYVPTDAESEIIPAAGHNFSEWTIVKEPTCIEKGSKERTCTVCGYKEAAELEVIEHTPGEKVIENNVVPTCTADGSYDEVIYCTVCAAELSRNTVTVPMTGHNLSAWAENADGTHIRYCENKDCTYSETENCTFTEWTVTKEPTCIEKGSKERTCTVCGYKETAEIKENGHTPGEKVIENNVAPTCTADGSYDEVIYCTVCEAELSRNNVTVSMTGHNLGDWTAENNGTHKRVCQNKDCTYSETENCIFTEWTVTKDPTCIEKGSKERTCTVCGYKETAEIPAAGHDMSVISYKAPTCTEDGNNEYYKCKRCGLYFKKNPSADTDITGKLSADFTSCQINGQKTSPHYEFIYDGTQASVPGFIFDTVKQGNSVTVNIYAKELYGLNSANIDFRYPAEMMTLNSVNKGVDAAAKNSEGFDRFRAEWNDQNPGEVKFGFFFYDNLWPQEEWTAEGYDVNAAYFQLFTINFNLNTPEYIPTDAESEIIPATGHKLSAWTENADGTHTRHCENEGCIYSETENCTFTEWTVTKDPTCIEKGSKERTCTVCGYKETAEIPAAGHKFGDWVITEATYMSEGKKERTCLVCGKTETDIIPMLQAEKEIKTEDGKISLKHENNVIKADVKLNAEEKSKGSAFEIVSKEKSKFSKQLYDITLTDSKGKVQPDGLVLVCIPLPEGYNAETTFVYYVSEKDSSLVKMNSYVKDGVVCFETDHFSSYAIVDESSKPGDANGDGQITAADARHVLRASVGLEADTEELRNIADMNKDGKITAADARIILRKSVGLE